MATTIQISTQVCAARLSVRTRAASAMFGVARCTTMLRHCAGGAHIATITECNAVATQRYGGAASLRVHQSMRMQSRCGKARDGAPATQRMQ